MRKPKPRKVTITRYVNPTTGERVKKGTPGARKVREKSETYYAKIKGKKVSLKTDDEAEAWEVLRRLLNGHKDPAGEAAKQAISSHVLDWLESVRHRGARSHGPARLPPAKKQRFVTGCAALWRHIP